MLAVKIHEFAYQELQKGVTWYDLQSIGLGAKFQNEVKKQVQKIAQNPSWFLVEKGNIYKAYIPKFPYKLLYSFNQKLITIWALPHLHRKPNYWQKRTK